MTGPLVWLGLTACSGEHGNGESEHSNGDSAPVDDSGSGTDDSAEGDDSATTDDSGTDDSATNPVPGDDDGDGWSEEMGDCDDKDSSIFPSAPEVKGDPTDHNCDGTAVAATAAIEDVGTRIFQAEKGTHKYQYVGGGVAFLPDITGDALPDVMIGSPTLQDAFESTGWGRAYVLAAPFDSTREDGDAVAQIDSVDRFDGGGTNVGSLGDLDDDGYPELLYGAPYGFYNEVGNVYLFSTPATGLLTTEMADGWLAGDEDYAQLGMSVVALGGRQWAMSAAHDDGISVVIREGLPAGKSPLDGALAVLHGDPGLSFTGLAPGDFDGDGIGDVAVGNGGRELKGTEAGALYLRSGPIAGEGELADEAATWLGSMTNEHAGDSVAAPGDMDGDGRDDVIVGAFNRPEIGFAGGGAYLVLGSANLDSVHVLDTEADLQIASENEVDCLGDSVTSLGDIDGDGRPDAAIHATRAFTTSGPPPRIYVLRSPPPTGVISAGGLDGAWIGTADEIAAGIAYFQSTPLVGGGDTDLDGIPEVLLGAPRVDTDVRDAGAVYLIEGTPF